MHTRSPDPDTRRMDTGLGTKRWYPDPVVVSETVQEYRRVRYYLCGKYFQHKGKRLHRVVWSDAYGPIPKKGFCIHHVAGDRTDNRVKSLQLLPKGHHVSLHSRKPRNPTDAQRAARSRNASGPCRAGNLRMSFEQRSAASRLGFERKKRD